VPKIRDLGIKVVPETMRPAECAQFTACACTAITNPCLGCTINLTIQCVLHTTITVCARPTLQCACTFNSPCLCTHLGSIPCGFGSGGCGFSPVCGGSIDPTIVQQPGELTREQVATLRDQLTQQMAALDEAAKNIGPKTAEEIDAREKALNEELADLKTRRKNLGK
jgi:hypothetical protein